MAETHKIDPVVFHAIQRLRGTKPLIIVKGKTMYSVIYFIRKRKVCGGSVDKQLWDGRGGWTERWRCAAEGVFSLLCRIQSGWFEVTSPGIYSGLYQILILLTENPIQTSTYMLANSLVSSQKKPYFWMILAWICVLQKNLAWKQSVSYTAGFFVYNSDNCLTLSHRGQDGALWRSNCNLRKTRRHGLARRWKAK